jgi:hypothetical protein
MIKRVSASFVYHGHADTGEMLYSANLVREQWTTSWKPMSRSRTLSMDSSSGTVISHVAARVGFYPQEYSR